MNFRTYDDLTKCIIRNLHKIPRDIDLIVGIPRSGTMAANILALYLNLPFADIEKFVHGGDIKTGTTRKSASWIRSIHDAKHVLVVDDSVSSGRAISETKKVFRQNHISCKVIYLAVYALAVSCKKVDIYFELCEQPRMFEWNFMHHWALEFCCMDIDGVLCEDPSFFQNDDGKRYEEFLNSAVPKFLPTQKVGILVSSRLEQYREQTEKWLSKYAIEYGDLKLMQNMTAKERAVDGRHAEYKAKIYKDSNAILFFESDYDQALEICSLSGRPVFCVNNMTLVKSNNVMEKMKVRNREFKVTMKRMLKKVLKKIKYVE